MSRKLSVLLILVVLTSFAQAKDECPLQCDCSDDFSVVKCRNMEKFPVFSFAKNVKTLDLTYGNIRTIDEMEVKAYTNLENLFVSHNPLDCHHATTYTLKHVLRDIMRLKSFDGHKIKCPDVPNLGRSPHGMASSGHTHHARAGTNVHIHGFIGHHPAYFTTPRIVAAVVFSTILGLMVVTGLCCVAVKFISAKKKVTGANDPISQMEEGTAAETQSQDTTDQALIEGLKRQRRSSQGFPENAIVNSEDEDVIEEKDYLKEKMKKQRRLSQGYARGAESSDEESDMVEINLNEDLYSSGN